MVQREKVKKEQKQKKSLKSRTANVGRWTRQEASLAINRRKQKVKHNKYKHQKGNNKKGKEMSGGKPRSANETGSKVSYKQEEAKGKAQEV